MRFVMEYSVGDGYTWWSTAIIPFEYESKEKFLYDMMTLVLETVDKKETVFNLVGHDFNIENFGYFKNPEKRKGFEFNEPDIKTLDDWFNSNLKVKWY